MQDQANRASPPPWAPAEMKERYNSGKVFIIGEAKDSQFRRFQVSTDEQVGVPKS